MEEDSPQPQSEVVVLKHPSCREVPDSLFKDTYEAYTELKQAIEAGERMSQRLKKKWVRFELAESQAVGMGGYEQCRHVAFSAVMKLCEGYGVEDARLLWRIRKGLIEGRWMAPVGRPGLETLSKLRRK